MSLSSARILAGAVLVALAAAPGTVHAQGPPTTNVEVDPITCWWRTSAGAVRVGQPFSLVLTCSLLDTEAARTVIDQSRLEPGALQLPPFDVVGGTHGGDVRTASRRFFQYDYTLRIVGEDVFGQDLTIPPLQLTYHIDSRAQRGETVQGRDLTYGMPSLPVRVASLVPDTATDIREAPAPTFSTIQTLEFRGRILRIVAGTLFALAAITLVAMLAGLFRRRRIEERAASRLLSDRAILAGVGRELQTVQQEARAGGWSPGLTGRALAALRVATAYALGRPVTQQPVVAGVVPLEGQLVVRGPLGARALVSSGVTTDAVSQAIARGATDGPMLEDLRDGLARLTIARYGQSDVADAGRLDDALEGGLGAVRQVAARHTRAAQAAAGFRRSLGGWRARVWAR